MSNLIYHLTIKFLFLFISNINPCQWLPNQCGCAYISPSIHNRIVGGIEAIPHSWPWTVSIRRFDRHLCGGVLISKQYILTAAHCFPQYTSDMLSSYSFAIGHHGIREINFISKAKRIVIHASYNINGKNANDIALIELIQLVDFHNNQFGFICLPIAHINDYPPIGTETWVVGWGTTKYEGLSAHVLMQVSVPITDNQGCLNKVTDRTKQICAGYDEGGKDSCQGDSGGPLVVDNGQGIFELVGLVSFGVRCAEYMKPGIYTRVSGYIDWIDKIINQTGSPMSYDIDVKPQALSSSSINYRHISYVVIFFCNFILISYISIRDE